MRNGRAGRRGEPAVDKKAPPWGGRRDSWLERGGQSLAVRGHGVRTAMRLGADTRATKLEANRGIAHDGVKLHGAGFIVTQAQAEHLGLGQRLGLEKYIRAYRNGRDLTAQARGLMVIDLFGLSASEVRRDYPEVYQHLMSTVKVGREAQAEKSATKDALAYLENWWLFGKPRTELRPALIGHHRFIATVDTAKHRLFQFVPSDWVLDDKCVIVASENPALMATLSSAIHRIWALATGALLEDRPVYPKSTCFDPFPFPDPSDAIRATLRALGEELDATRKTVQAEHPDLTLTGLYNVLEKLRAGTDLTDAEADVKARGRVLILKDLHDQIDRATADAYGWPHDLADEQILERLVSLNAERAKEEAAGHVRWLRPDYQIPRFAKGAAAQKTGELDLGTAVVAIDKGLPAFPKDKGEQVMAIRAVLQAEAQPMDPAAVARAFKGKPRAIEQRVVQALITLVRYAEITALPDGRFAARQAA